MTPQREERFLEVLRKRQNSLTVVMENISDEHNISAVLRTCDAVGIHEVYVLHTMEIGTSSKLKLGKKSSASARKWIDVHYFSDKKKCMEELRKKYKKIYSTLLAESSVSVYSLDLTESVALIFGNEHDGVSKEISEMCDGNFIIPQVGMIRSLNISVACAVTLYEAFRQRSAKGLYASAQLSEVEISKLFSEWKDK